MNFEFWDQDDPKIQQTALPSDPDENKLVKDSAILAYKTLIADLDEKPDNEYPAR